MKTAYASIGLSLFPAIFSGCSSDKVEPAAPPAAGKPFAAVERQRQTVEPDALKLVPPQAVAVARIANAEALLENVRGIVDGFQPGMGGILALAPLLAPTGLRERDIDLTSPASFAMEMGEAGPVSTFILPAKDPAEAAVTATIDAVANGKYLGLKTAGQPAVGDGSELAAGLPAGDVAIRVDVQRALQPYRPMLEAYLDMDSLAAMSPQFGAPATRPVLEPMVKYARRFLDGMKTLDVSASIANGALDLDLVIGVTDEFAMEPATGFDLLKRVSLPEANIIAYMSADWSSMVGMYSEAMKSLAPSIPGGADLQILMQKAAVMYETLGRDTAIAYRFAPDGFSAIALSRGGKPEEFRASIKDYMAESQKLVDSMGGPAGSFAALPARKVEGIEFSAWKLDMDSMSQGTPSSLVFGKDGMPFAVGSLADHTIMLIGDVDQQLKNVTNAIQNDVLYDVPLLQEVRGLHAEPKFFVAFDVRSFFQFAASVSGVELPAGPRAMAWVSFAASGTNYELQIHADLKAIAGAMKDMEKAARGR